MTLPVEFIGTTFHLDISSTHDYNTRSKEMSDSKILDKSSKLREKLVENFKRASLISNTK